MFKSFKESILLGIETTLLQNLLGLNYDTNTCMLVLRMCYFLLRNKHEKYFFFLFCTLQYCKKVWLGLWNSSAPAEPESRDEQKIKDFMVQKYERKRWYMPPQQATANNTSQSAPEPKPLKQLLGENTPPVTVQVSLKVHAHLADLVPFKN